MAAESDIPVIGNMAYERMKYPIGLFIQAEMDENILKIGFFITDILTAGGRRPLYTLFIDKAKDCFIGYDYRLKGWTNKMLDKIEWPSGIKYSHAWCAANSLDQIWEILGEEYKKIMCIMLFYNLKKEYAEEKEYRKTDCVHRPGIR